MIRWVDPRELDRVWPEVRDSLAKALEHAQGEMDIGQMRLLVSQGAATMLICERGPIIRGACVFTAVNEPNYRVAWITAIAGRFIADAETYDEFKSHLRKMGFSRVRGYAREAVARLYERQKLGLRVIYQVVDDEV